MISLIEQPGITKGRNTQVKKSEILQGIKQPFQGARGCSLNITLDT